MSEIQHYLNLWLRPGPKAVAPMDAFSPEWWHRAFDSIGPFHARHTTTVSNGDYSSTLEVVSAPNLGPPTVPLYRASTRALANRWSWSDSLEVARAFQHWREGTVWQAKPAHVFGRVDIVCPFPGLPGVTRFTEWIVKPDLTTLTEHLDQRTAAPEGNHDPL